MSESVDTNTAKVLWKTFGDDRPDNYVDSKFLESLIVNADVGQRSYWNVVLGALFVANHLCLVMVLAGTAYLLHYQEEDVISTRIFMAQGIAFCIGLLLHVIVECRTAYRGARRALLSTLNVVLRAGILLGLTCVLSPVYATLTTSISPDTTVACICVLLIVHMYLYDYSEATHPGKKPTLGASLGLASGMCASVLMATRMKHLSDVISIVRDCIYLYILYIRSSHGVSCVQIVLSLQLYIAAPYVQYNVSKMIPHGAQILNIIGIGSTLFFLSNISVVVTSWLIAVLLLVVFLCPMWLVRIEKFKAHLNGPWDEAVPHL